MRIAMPVPKEVATPNSPYRNGHITATSDTFGHSVTQWEKYTRPALLRH